MVEIELQVIATFNALGISSLTFSKPHFGLCCAASCGMKWVKTLIKNEVNYFFRGLSVLVMLRPVNCELKLVNGMINYALFFFLFFM